MPDSDLARGQFLSALTIYRAGLILSYAVLAAGCCVYTWTRYNINYVYVFGATPTTKMTHWQLWKIGLILLGATISTICIVYIHVKLDVILEIDDPSAWVVLMLIVFFVIYCY